MTRNRRARRSRARELLDRARAGAPVHSQAITQALIDSGDLSPDALSQVRMPAGTWERPGAAAILAPASWLDPMVASM